MDTRPSGTRALGLEYLHSELFEMMTDYLSTQDLKNLQLTSKPTFVAIRGEWVRFLQRRIVRHCQRNTRVLSFVVLLNSFYEHYLDKGHATGENISAAAACLREGLVPGAWHLSDYLERLKRPETLQVMCSYLDTIDDLTDDFASQLVSPIPTRQKGLSAWEGGGSSVLWEEHWIGCGSDVRAHLRWPTADSPITLSTTERARFREGFLAHQVLCLLSEIDKIGTDGAGLHPLTSQLSQLELERILSIRHYLFDTWVWKLVDGYESETWCKSRELFFKKSRDFFLTSERAYDFATGGIITLARELDPSRPSWTELDYDDVRWDDQAEKHQPGFDASAPPRPRYKEYGDQTYVDYWALVNDGLLGGDGDRLHQPRLSPQVDEGQDSQITSLWRLFKDAIKAKGFKLILDQESEHPADEIFRNIKPNDLSLSFDGLANCRNRGWVFLDADTFETVQAYWKKWVRYEEEWFGGELTQSFYCTDDWDLSYLRDFEESLGGLF